MLPKIMILNRKTKFVFPKICLRAPKEHPRAYVNTTREYEEYDVFGEY